MCSLIPAIIGLVGVAVGWFVTHRATISREKRIRRGAFVGFLLQWKSTVERKTHTRDAFDAYMAGVHQFHAELGKIREDFLDSPDFLAAAETLGQLSDKEIIQNAKDGRIPIIMAIDRLVALTK